jgi:hypothetical protein
MKSFKNQPVVPTGNGNHRPLWPWLLALVISAVIILGVLWLRTVEHLNVSILTPPASASHRPGPQISKLPKHTLAISRAHHNGSTASAEAIVAGKLKAFTASRRKLAHALAQRHGIAVPDRAEKFFDAVKAGNWDEIKAQYKAINGGDGSVATSGRPPDITPLWPAISDAYGVAEQVHIWPAQQLLDYGNTMMNSLSPGMVYIGGTDDGRWVPELMNETSGDTPQVIITQNGLADQGYLDYLNLQYGGQLNTLTADDQSQAMQDYLADYRQRLAHDQQFPNEPPQVLPGESGGVHVSSDGQLALGGPDARTSVMAVNEILLTTLMGENPQLSFGLQESFPLKSTYADALPVGPIMQLNASGGQNTFTADTASQAVDYWSSTTQQLLSDPDAADSTTVQKAYAKDETSTANLLAAHGYNAEAEQIYGAALQLSPSSFETASDYVNLLLQQNQVQQAIAVAQAAAQANPNNQQLQNLLQQAKGSTPR